MVGEKVRRANGRWGGGVGGEDGEVLAAGGVGGAGDVEEGNGKAAGHIKANGKLVLVEGVRKVLRARGCGENGARAGSLHI